jgi:hypothetical protein
VFGWRRNQLYAEDFGVTAELLPMLLGFFSYKVSTILEVSSSHHLYPFIVSRTIGFLSYKVSTVLEVLGMMIFRE